MTTSNLYNCLNCSRQYNPKVLKKCPVCQTPHLQSAAPNISSSSPAASPSSWNSVGTSPAASVPLLKSSQKQEFGRVAISSAKIVNNYGLAIQIFGAISALIIFAYFAFSYGDGYGSRAGYVFLGIATGLITMAANLILGALYRMLANYVLYKTTD